MLRSLSSVGSFLIFIFGVSFFAIGQPVSKSLAGLIGKPIDFSGTTLRNENFQLNKYHGKVVMLNFWSTGCGVCNAELADFNRIVESFSDSAFVLISVIDETADELTSPETSPYSLRIHPRKNGFYQYNRKFYGNDLINFEIITDGRKIRDLLGLSYSSPQTLYIDKEGIIRDVSNSYIGSTDKQHLNYTMHHNKIQWVFHGVNWENKKSVIEISSQESIRLDSLSVSCDLVNIFPQTEPKGTITHKNGSVYISIKHQIPTTAYLSIESNRHYIFLMPYDTLKITLDENYRLVDFTGNAADINIYRQQKENRFGDIIQAKYSIAYNTADLSQMQQNLNAFTRAELSFLDSARAKYKLPDWFYQQEWHNIFYLSASYKMSVVAYKRYQGNTVVVPEGYYRFLDSTKISNKEAILSNYYYSFLDNLASYLHFSDSLRKLPVKERRSVYLPLKFRFYDENLAPEIRDIAYARELSIIVQAPFPYDSAYVYKKMQRINNELIKNITAKFLNKIESNKLKAGEPAPNFYLTDTNDSLRTLDEYAGNIILLSFWGTWCKPCIEEFPYENSLAAKLADKNFKLITICLDSNFENWQRYLKKYDLHGPNFFANKGWSEKLRQDYDFSAIPYYVLLNKDLTVIQTRFLRPSNSEIIAEIMKWLK